MYIYCLTNWDQAGQHTACSVGWWLVADGWCWFVLREEYCCLVAVGWFVVREKYYWLVADKPSEQGDSWGSAVLAFLYRQLCEASKEEEDF
jgi:hypothetical protein